MSTKRPLDLDRYQKRLTEMKTQLETDLQRFHSDEVLADGGPEEPGPGQHWEHSGYGDHQADDGTELFEREKNIGLETTLQEHLRQVEHALARIEEGTYGTCERCGKPIRRERLDAKPEATYCIECQAIIDRQSPAAVSPTANRY